jgi:hypothetical protein
VRFKLFILFLFVLSIHGCGQGYKANTVSNLQKTQDGLGFHFSPNHLEIDSNQESVNITGDCASGSYVTHYVQWTAGSNQGRAPGICQNGRFAVSLPKNQLQVVAGYYTLSAQIFGVTPDGVSIPGPSDTLTVTVI